MRLSVAVPVHDEAATVLDALKRLLAVELPLEVEVLVVDDGSTDATPALLAGVDDPRVTVLRHVANRGKGAAVRTAASRATGDWFVVFDADLEYDPRDLPALLAPVLAGDSDVVYGARNFGSHNAYSYWYVVGNRVVTTAANVLFNAYISDLETCWKLVPLDLWRALEVRHDGFGLEAEVTAKLLRRRVRPFEVPVSYRARTRAEGKKLTWRDGLEALSILLRVRLLGR